MVSPSPRFQQAFGSQCLTLRPSDYFPGEQFHLGVSKMLFHTHEAKTESVNIQAPSLPLSSAPVSGIGASSYPGTNSETWWFGLGHKAETL